MNSQAENGGALFIKLIGQPKLLFTNVSFVNNMAVFSKIGYGGAIYLDTSDDGVKDISITMENMLFHNCRSPLMGGCIYHVSGKRRNLFNFYNVEVIESFSL